MSCLRAAPGRLFWQPQHQIRAPLDRMSPLLNALAVLTRPRLRCRDSEYSVSILAMRHIDPFRTMPQQRTCMLTRRTPGRETEPEGYDPVRKHLLPPAPARRVPLDCRRVAHAGLKCPRRHRRVTHAAYAKAEKSRTCEKVLPAAPLTG